MSLGPRAKTLGALTLVVVAIGITLATSRIRHLHELDTECQLNLRREFASFAFRGNQLATPEEVRLAIGGAPAGRCPRCRASYIYRPFTGRRSTLEDSQEQNRMIAWCPEPCHGGRRHVLIEDAQAIVLDERDFRNAVEQGFVVVDYVGWGKRRGDRAQTKGTSPAGP